jgi:arylsulfatase A-like enzyme
VITADHGDAFFEHGSVSHGGTIHNEEVHVPLVIHFPEAFAKQRGFATTGTDGCPASTVDLLPTALDFVGAPAAEGIDGASLVPSARAGSCAREVFSERTLEEGKIAGAALVSEGHKLIVDYGDGGQRKLQLYDLASDPGETRDLAQERADQARRLDEALTNRLNADGSSMARWESVDGSLPDEQLDALRELGYVE